NPGKTGYESLWLHYSISPKQDVSAALAADRILLSFWVYVEKGSFSANVKCRASKGEEYITLFQGDANVQETGKWVQVKLEGQGQPGITRSDVRFEIPCPGDFIAYLYDFYY